MAGHAGQDLNLNNVNLRFQFKQCIRKVSLHFGEYGGNVNLAINGEFKNVENFISLNGATIGGVLVQVTQAAGGGGVKGVIVLTGVIETLAIGGQELWVDHICLEACEVDPNPCVEFDGVPAGTTYVVGDTFTDAGVTMSLERFQWGNLVWTDTGHAFVDVNQMAGHAGQDLNLNNINLRLRSETCIAGISLRFGEYGGNVNLDVNDNFHNVENFMDLHGVVVGGVLVQVTDLGGGKGRLDLIGNIKSLAVGGQELWVDHICREECLPAN
jgi:hypothetical protein